MMKIDWHYLCVEMMLEYIPQDVATQESYDKFQEICDHFISVSRVLSTRIKSEQNITEIASDESEDTAKIAQMMKRLARQMLEFLKQQREETIITATTAIQRYEGMLVSENLSNSTQSYLKHKIHELRDVLETT